MWLEVHGIKVYNAGGCSLDWSSRLKLIQGLIVLAATRL